MPTLVRPAAHTTSGFKSRLEDLCKCSTFSRQGQLPAARRVVKGQSQMPAWSESERDSAGSAGESASVGRSPAQEPATWLALGWQERPCA